LNPILSKPKRLLSMLVNTVHLLHSNPKWIEAFYKNVEDRMLNIYGGAWLRAWRIDDRQELAEYWQEQADWFDQMLARMEEARKTLKGFCVPEPAALLSLIETLTELVEACRSAHQLLA
jgi:hypothetical protein